MARLCLTSWNIQWARGIDGQVNCERIASEIAAVDPDVICLQEVASGMPDLPGADGSNQFDVFARLFPDYRLIAGPGVETFDSDGRARLFGNAILSRLPIISVRRHALPWIADGAQTMPRLLLEVIVVAACGPVRVMTTHLDYFSAAARAAQLEAVRSILVETQARAHALPKPASGPYLEVGHPVATVLCGDFNMPPESDLWPILTEAGPGFSPLVDSWRVLHKEAHPPSFCITEQVYGPPQCTDYVLTNADLAKQVTGIHYDIATRSSDHQPVTVEFRI